jgi:hypothetical protein
MVAGIHDSGHKIIMTDPTDKPDTPADGTIAGIPVPGKDEEIDDASTLPDIAAGGYDRTQAVLPGDGYDATLVDAQSDLHQATTEDATQHVDTMEFDEPDVDGIFTLDFPEIKPNTEEVFKRCFGRLKNFMPAIMYFQGDHKAGDRLITQSYNDYHIPGEEESLLMINYLEILESKKKICVQYLADRGQKILAERMKYGGFSRSEFENNLDRQGVTGQEKETYLETGKIPDNKLQANLKKIRLRLQVNITAIDERIKKLLEGPLFTNAYYGQTVIYDIVKMTRSKVLRDKKGREYIGKDESMMGVVVGNILHELAMLDPRMNMAERLLKDDVYLSEQALAHMDMYLKLIHENEYLTPAQTREFIQYFECIVRLQRSLDNRGDALHKWLNTLVAVSEQHGKKLEDGESMIPPQHLSYEHKMVFDMYNSKLDEVLSTYLYHYYDLEQYTSILSDIIITVPELNMQYGVTDKDETTDALVHAPLFADNGKLNSAVFDADARQKYILPFFKKLLLLVRQRDQPGFLSGAIEEALDKYGKLIDEILRAEYSRTILGLMQHATSRIDVLKMIENKSRVYIQPEGKVIFDTLYHLNASISDDAECLQKMQEYLQSEKEKMSPLNKQTKEEELTRNLEEIYRLALANVSSHHWMEEPYGFHFTKYHRFAESRLRKVREIIVPMLARKLFYSADDMYSRYRRLKMRENVVLQDTNFELWLDHFFAVYDSKSASRKFNSSEYRFFDKLKLDELAIKTPTTWIKDMLTQLFLLHSQRQFNQIVTSSNVDDFREFLDLTFERLNTILHKSAERRRRKSDFNKRLQQRIAEQKDTAEAAALQTLLESETEQAFAKDVKETMQRRIIEDEESRQSNLDAGTQMKRSFRKKKPGGDKRDDGGILKKIFGGLFGD